MTILLGSIADDYTGASDLANTLTKNGLRTVQTVGIPDPSLALPDVDAVVVSLKIRSVAARRRRGCGDASRTLAARARRGPCALQDLLDLRFHRCRQYRSGHRGSERCRGRRHGAGDARLSGNGPHRLSRPSLRRRTAAERKPAQGPSPQPDARRQSRAGSRPTIARRRRACRSGGRRGRAATPSRRRLDALRAAGVTARPSPMRSSNGISRRSARSRSKRRYPPAHPASALALPARSSAPAGYRPAPQETADAIRPVGGLSAIVAGSCSRGDAAAARRRRTLDARPAARPGKTACRPATRLPRRFPGPETAFPAGPSSIAASAAPETVSRLQAQYGRDASGHAIETATSIIAAELVARGVRRLVVAGGETSGAAVDRLAIPAFLIGPEIAPGVPVLRTVGNAQGDMLLALKSGNFGGEDFFTAALAMMH